MLPSLLACTWVPLEDLEEKLACCDSDTAGVVDPGVVQAEGTTDLGVVFVGRSAETRLVVENLGPGDVTLDASLDPDDEWSGVLASSLLSAGADTALDITLLPRLSGDKQATLTLSGGAEPVVIELSAVAQDDVDRDGHGSEATGGDDCDDADSDVYPGAAETWYDGTDEDCDGASDFDQDADGWPLESDCDDQDASVKPDAVETWYDGVDQDCDDASDFDQDGDGYDRDADCDDTDADAGGGEEDWNRRDDDCDDWFDEDLTVGAVATTRLLGDTNGLALGYDGALGLTDLDGDGLDDVVAASDQVDDGVAYVVAGVDLPGLDANISAHSHAQLVGTSSTPLATVSLAMGDLTGDSGTDLLVGAELGRAGRVWVLDGDRVTGGVSLESSADAEITGDSGWDDLHLAAVADIDGDGVADLVTGAVYDDYQDATTRSDTGNIAWFAGGAFTGELSLGDAAGQIHGAEEGDSLGASLVVGDWNADGYGDAAAGAPGFDGSGSDCGAIVIFAGAASPSWDGTAEAAWLTIAGDVSGLQLGAEPLPAPGDIDGDGRDDLGIRSAASGEAWIFTVLADRDGAYTVADADVSVEEEATALALADVEGYGFAAVILGEAGDDTVGTDAGAIAVWRGPVGTGVLGEPEVRIVGDAAGDALGSGLAVGDTDGDGRVDLLVGAPGVDDGERAGGAVYVVTGR